MDAINNKSFLITTMIKSILMIAGIWFAATNNVVRFITLGYVIFTLIGTTVLLFKTTNFFKEIICDDFTDKMNQIGIWVTMGINASLTIGLIFDNPILRAIGLVFIIGDLITSIVKLIMVIREERLWRGMNLDYEFIHAMAAMASKAEEAEDNTEE